MTPPLKKTLFAAAGTLLLLAGALIVLLPMSPANMPLTYRDSGVFLYTGWRITQGEVPYRDVWDHKPPVIFFVNALGLLLTPGSRWGVWALEVVSLAASALLLYRLVSRRSGPLPAALSTLLLLSGFVFVINGGNFTTEFALPLQLGILTLAAGMRVPASKSAAWSAFWIGVLAGAAFLTKQNTIGAAVAFGLAWGCRAWKTNSLRSGLAALLALTAGFLAVCLPVGLYFVVHRAAGDFWSAAFVYNLVYSSVKGLSARALVLRDSLVALGPSGLFPLGLAGFGLGLWKLLRPKNAPPDLFLLALILDLPLELALVSASGRSYPHYFLSLLPALALWAGLACQAGLQLFDRLPQAGLWRAGSAVLLAAVLVACVRQAYFQGARDYHTIPGQDVIDYIDAHTRPGDPVLMWGAQASINFLAARPSPTRFVYQYPLYDAGYGSYEMFCEYLNSILTDPPHLIIDTHTGRTPFLLVPINGGEAQRMAAQIRQRYTRVATLSGWDVYALAGMESRE